MFSSDQILWFILRPAIYIDTSAPASICQKGDNYIFR
jgi:hypothetical protein